MIKRYLSSFLAIVLLLVLYLLSLLPILAVRHNLEPRQFVYSLLIWGILAGMLLVPALAFIMKKTWFFRGRGEPVVLDLLQDVILGVNELDCPVAVRKKGKKMIASWRCHDADWCEQFAESGMKRLYELWLRFDNHTKTVILTDRYRSVNWDLCPISVKTGRFSFSKPFFKVEIGKEWGVDNYRDTVPDDYSFTPSEIKSPVLSTIIQNGWNARFSLF